MEQDQHDGDGDDDDSIQIHVGLMDGFMELNVTNSPESCH